MKDVLPKTISDHILNKQIYVNGKRMCGVLRFATDFDIRNGDIKTLVNLTVVVKKNSLHISRPRKGIQRISFNTTNHKR